MASEQEVHAFASMSAKTTVTGAHAGIRANGIRCRMLRSYYKGLKAGRGTTEELHDDVRSRVECRVRTRCWLPARARRTL